MKIDIDVNVVLASPFDGSINLFQRFFAYQRPILTASPVPIRQRESSKIKAPLSHRGEIKFLISRARVRIAWISESAL